MEDEMMDEMQLIFVEEMQKRIQTLSDSLENRDITTVQHLGHKIKGTGGSFGFDNVTQMGSVLESSAKAGDWHTIEKTVSELLDWYAKAADPEGAN